MHITAAANANIPMTGKRQLAWLVGVGLLLAPPPAPTLARAVIIVVVGKAGAVAFRLLLQSVVLQHSRVKSSVKVQSWRASKAVRSCCLAACMSAVEENHQHFITRNRKF